MIEEPKIRNIDVVLRSSDKIDFCIPSQKYNGVSFCVHDGDVISYRYDKETFEKVTGASFEKIEEKIKKCPLCRTGFPSFGKSEEEKRNEVLGKLLDFLRTVIKKLCDDYNVPVPRVLLEPCPPNIRGSGTCYNSETKTIYIHPLDAGPQAIFHEFKHYLDDITGKPYDENGATAFARAMTTSMFPTGQSFFSFPAVNLNTNSSIYGYRSEIKMFERLNGYYSPVAPYLGVTGEDLNIAWTPEIITSLIEIGEEMAIPDNEFLQLLTELGISLTGLAGSALVRELSMTDKAILHNIVSHLVMKLIRRATPSKFGLLSAQARDFGRTFASFDMSSIPKSITYGIERIKQDLAVAAKQIGNMFGAPSPAPTVVQETKEVPESLLTAPFSELDLSVSALMD